MLRGLPVADAQAQLMFLPSRKARDLLGAVLKSVVANASHNLQVAASDLKVSDIIINEGFAFKRFSPVSRGQAHPILKKTSHITVTLETLKEQKPRTTKQKVEITTLTGDQYVAEEHTHSHGVDEKVEVEDQSPSAEAEPQQQKEMEVYNQKRTLQGGGDRKKSFRRKSM